MPSHGRMRSVDASRFAMVPRSDVPRSAFDVHHTHKTTFNAGYLVPVYVDEVLPGDSFRVRMSAFARLATPIVPVMDNLILESFFFYVPNRILWENWERFMGQQDNPGDSTAFLMPYVQIPLGGTAPGTLGDYFGITLNGAPNDIAVSSLPFRAYNLIWNEWFRDQDLQDPIFVELGDGPDVFGGPYVDLQRRGKRHDYFTTARPWPEKPMNTDLTGLLDGAIRPGGPMTLMRNQGVGAPVSGLGVPAAAPSAPGSFNSSGGRTETANTFSTGFGANVFLKADPGGFGPDVRVLVNDIRTAFMVQGLLERNARGGTRYAEIVRSHFGVVSPDARLQRAEYLGGGRTVISVNPVAQTSATGVSGTTTVLGELAGVGTAVAQGHGFSQSFTEHGLILGMISVRADLTYQNGINRMWFRRTQFDFYWPGLAHLGEQAILRREIWSNGDDSNDKAVFGYQERWSEYKYKPNRVSGMFRSNVTDPSQPIDMWHFAQNFETPPVLNDLFIQEDPPVDRVLQVITGAGEQFLMDSLFECRCVRPMPMFSIPGVGPRL